jgi:pimeloyl-ACP methyl ester carboxylesterase
LETLSVLEYAAFLTAAPLFAKRGNGDSHPVLVLPGFTGSDRTTGPLRSVLRDKGFTVHGWGLGPNVGPHPHVIDGLERRLRELTGRYGTSVSLVGWSLGGIYARELARAYPGRVRMVITLASPYRFRTGDRGHASELYAAVGPEHDPFTGRAHYEQERPPLPVPTTSIYTRTDGVVHWSACIESAGAQRENIEVIGTHYGLGYNLGALIAITDRLAQPADRWEPFRPPLALRHLFPRPLQWRTTEERQRRPA